VTLLRLGLGSSFTGDAATLRDPLATASHFGAALAAEGEHGLAVGAPELGGGHVVTFVSPDTSAPPTRQASWRQAAGKPETGDGYGRVLCPPEAYQDF
jgi:hypothetical protein